MIESMPIEGGCLCGAVRYRINSPPLWTGYCHCSDCRRSTGAPAVMFVGAAWQSVAITTGARAIHESSKGVRRGFCSACGTPLTYESEKFPGEVHFYAGTCDEPGSLLPSFHVWHEESLAWFETVDTLPRHAKLSGRTTHE